MSAQNQTRPAFHSIDFDPMDEMLEAKAAEKGIPTLVQPNKVITPAELPPPQPTPKALPRPRMKSSKLEFPEYVWEELRERSFHQRCSIRYLVLKALRNDGYHIDEADMIEDGRRVR